MIKVEPVRRPARILAGVFAEEAQLRKALVDLRALGIGGDFVGALVRETAGGSENLLSVMVPKGAQEQIASLLESAGALAVGEPQELAPLFGRAPHPGVFEDRDLKMPSLREYPASLMPPAPAWPRAPMRTLDSRERVLHFAEVELGYNPEEALTEASRCLLCPTPSCQQGCPVRNDIPGFLRTILEGDFKRGVEVLRRTSSFPGICGRVCNKIRQCEGSCILLREGAEPVAIGALERFLADWELEAGLRLRQIEGALPPDGKRVAVVGSGPSGLAAAGDLALLGHSVTLFEALPVAGGALAWGVPTFRLPPKVLEAELDFLYALGVVLQLSTKVGRDLTIEELFAQGYEAIFVGAGANVSASPGLPGEGLRGVYSATEFLARAKLSRLLSDGSYRPPEVGRRLAVIGAGNTAMDVAQTALRLGAEEATTDVAHTAVRLGVEQVTVVYRRSEVEMPAREEEVKSAKEEGVTFRFLTAPVRFIGDAEGRVVAMECVEMELGRPDASGRRTPVPRSGSEFTMPVDCVVLALGYQPDPSLLRDLRGLDADRSGLLIADRETGRTSRKGVWSGGDVVSGPDTVVRAMGAGKRAAKDINRYLRGK